MKEHEGGNEVLTPLMKILENQDSYELILQKDVKDSHLLLCKNGLCWYYEGIVKESVSVLLELSREGVIEVDANARELLRVNGKDVNDIEHKQVLDLSDDGKAMCSTINPMVGACCMTVRVKRSMKGS